MKSKRLLNYLESFNGNIVPFIYDNIPLIFTFPFYVKSVKVNNLFVGKVCYDVVTNHNMSLQS